MLISIVVRRDEGRFVAHALDFDLMAAGSTVPAALESLREVVATYIAACQELGLNRPEEWRREAPKEYLEAAERMLADPKVEVFVGHWDLSDLLPGQLCGVGRI